MSIKVTVQKEGQDAVEKEFESAEEAKAWIDESSADAAADGEGGEGADKGE